MSLSYAGLDRRWAQLGQQFMRRVESVSHSDSYILGREVSKFEEEFADYVGARHCVGVGNGLDALRLVLQVLPLHQAARVAVPAETFVASFLAVIQAGLEPVPIDVDEASGLMNTKSIGDFDDLDAIMAIHLHGSMVELPDASVRGPGQLVIEDAAQAHGARNSHGRNVGALATAAAFSFYPTKNLGAIGDAGAITTDSELIASAARSLRSYGFDANGVPPRAQGGWNSRLDTIQAAWLRLSLPYLDGWNAARRDIAHDYRRLLGESLRIDETSPGSECVFHHFIIHVHNRDAVQRKMLALGVPTEVHYRVPAYRHPALLESQWGAGHSQGRFSSADRRAESMLSLPIHPWMTHSEVKFVADTVLRCLD